MRSDWDEKFWKEWLLWRQWIKWLEEIDITTEGFTPYPLQIANAIRIMNNDAVFVFDEVGCGKTISAGIMAKTYLENCDVDAPKDILVITTNTIKTNEQFIQDWEKIDTYIRKKVTIYNNLFCSDLKLLQKDKKWGLVVIDEAHEFNNTDTKKYETLISNLRANKVVFLTATPLRGGDDFEFYKELAKAILGKPNYDFSALDRLNNNEASNLPLICAMFDPTYPVTRYFKDTVKYLDIHEKKEKAHRVIPEIWKNEEFLSREDTVAKGILKKLDESKSSRFIIFVRYKTEAEVLKKVIIDQGDTRIQNGDVEIIFADNKYKLRAYSRISPDLPKILIVNYQIGEAGVNLPGYDHVIHWHISSDPARLEQRYGRIDRMTSTYEKIYSVFVDSQSWDSNQTNFMAAISYTMDNLLMTLPARNVLLTKETLTYYKSFFEYKRKMIMAACEKYKESLRFLEEEYNSDVMFGELLQCYYDCNKDLPVIPSKEEWRSIYEIMKEFIDRIVPVALERNETVEEKRHKSEELFESLIAVLKRNIKYLDNKLKNNYLSDADPFLKCIERIEKDSDKIFYLTEKADPGCLKTIGAQGVIKSNIKDRDAVENKGCATFIEAEEGYARLRELIKIMDATRLLKSYAYDDVQYATELICELGEIAYGDDWTKGGYPSEMAVLGYKNKR